MQSLLFLRENPRKKDLKRDLSSTFLINPPSGKEEEREEIGRPRNDFIPHWVFPFIIPIYPYKINVFPLFPSYFSLFPR